MGRAGERGTPVVEHQLPRRHVAPKRRHDVHFLEVFTFGEGTSVPGAGGQ